ncbi:MAG: putative hydro-lyase, partial [Desulfobacteraceae bacterium]|nr:putative hydro-lyase [Desulfobacteraceae bacterium]
WSEPTSGFAPAYAQANLVILDRRHAFDFLLFCTRNPKPCPILDVLEPGCFEPMLTAPGGDIRSELPRYRIWRHGELEKEVTDITPYWNSDMVSFLLGCSFSFESALLAARIPIRNIEEGKNVSMYVTNRTCIPAGPFSTPLVVSMRPIPDEQVVRAAQITSRYVSVHGAPVHIGDPARIGIKDLSRPEFGEAVEIKEGETPVFWACGVTSSVAAISAKPELCITHAPGHMFITDVLNETLAAI